MNKFVRNGMDLGKSFFKYNGIWLLCLKIEREVDVNCLVLLSPSVRKVWIEIDVAFKGVYTPYVTFCEEGVD